MIMFIARILSLALLAFVSWLSFGYLSTIHTISAGEALIVTITGIVWITLLRELSGKNNKEKPTLPQS